MKAKKFDTDFDSGKNITAVVDFSKARRPLQEQKRLNVDFPTWMIEALDKEADRSRVSQSSRFGWRNALNKWPFTKGNTRCSNC